MEHFPAGSTPALTFYIAREAVPSNKQLEAGKSSRVNPLIGFRAVAWLPGGRPRAWKCDRLWYSIL